MVSSHVKMVMTYQPGLKLWCSGVWAVLNISEGGGQSSQHVLAYNSGSWAPFDIKTSAKDAQEHDLSDDRGPGTVGGHLNVVMKV